MNQQFLIPNPRSPLLPPHISPQISINHEVERWEECWFTAMSRSRSLSPEVTTRGCIEWPTWSPQGSQMSILPTTEHLDAKLLHEYISPPDLPSHSVICSSSLGTRQSTKIVTTGILQSPNVNICIWFVKHIELCARLNVKSCQVKVLVVLSSSKLIKAAKFARWILIISMLPSTWNVWYGPDNLFLW